MSYELADGSMSTDYKIGDEFTHYEKRGLFKFEEADGSSCPWFEDMDERRSAESWCYLTPVKASKHSTLINQLRETIKQLEATIQELEQ
jgi:hypothetical protein